MLAEVQRQWMRALERSQMLEVQKTVQQGKESLLLRFFMPLKRLK